MYVVGYKSFWADGVCKVTDMKQREYFLKGIELPVHRCEEWVEILGDY
jgi:hypothetical protein